MTAVTAAPRRPRGRPTRGVRVETKLPAEALASVEFLTRTEGPDRSAVLARLVETGIAAWDLLTPDIGVIRAWAEDWPTCCGVLLHQSGGAVNIWHVDPDVPDGILDHLHQERIDGNVAAAARRLRAAAPLVTALGYGFPDGYVGGLVIRCIPEAER